MIYHRGRGVPNFLERWDPSDSGWVWFCWTEIVGTASITLSEWTLPAGWTSEDEETGQTYRDAAGTDHADSNGILLSTTATSGQHTVANKVTLSDGRVFERSVSILVEDI